MPKNSNNNIPWVEGYLRLAGLDSRMIELLKAIELSGSINKAAKTTGLSYKGAWQMIERANDLSPKILVATKTGGSKGGGTCLTEAGVLLLSLFKRLERQHNDFIEQLNRNLADDLSTLMLLQRHAIKTSACNQLFGSIVRIIVGAVNAEIVVSLKEGLLITTTISLTSMHELGLKYGANAVLLINSADILLATDYTPNISSARNQLLGKLVKIQNDTVNAEVVVLLPNGEMLTAMITQQSINNMTLALGIPIWVIFKTNAPVLGILASS